MKRLLVKILFFLVTALPAYSGESILESYPHLNNYRFAEPEFPIKFGFGIAPLLFQSNRIGTGLSLFQMHSSGKWLDFELFNLSYGLTYSDASYNSDFYTMKTSPKIVLSSVLSIGPLIGLEFISFRNAQSQITKNSLATPLEPFSTFGFIYGLTLVEKFRLFESVPIRLSQIYYLENYSISTASNGWKYSFQDSSLGAEISPIKKSSVFLIEISALY